MERITYVNGCWLLSGYQTKGYVKIKVGGSMMGAHRFFYQELVGPIPKGLTIDHLCRVRNCVNPDHLEAVTQRVNTLRSPISPTAVNARKVRCIHGHPLKRRGNRRICSTCEARSQREYKARKLAA